MPADYSFIILPLFFLFVSICLLGSLKVIFDSNIVFFIISLILGILLLVVGLYCFWNYGRDKYLNLVDNKIKIRTNYFCRFEEKVFNKEDIVKSEIKYDEHIDSDNGSITHYYTISIITKEEKQIVIFTISERNKIENMDGLNIVVNYINYYIQDKREMY